MPYSEPFIRFLETLRALDPVSAAQLLTMHSKASIANYLNELEPRHALKILENFSPNERARIARRSKHGKQWLCNLSYPEGTVGQLMEFTPAIFRPDTLVQDVTQALRDWVRQQLISYIFVTTADEHLVGVVTFRDLLFGGQNQTLAEVMVGDPFYLHPETSLEEAMHAVVTRHYPTYPVCDAQGRLIGVVRGHILFEQQAFEISAQAGAMVGVEKEERTLTPWRRSFKFRHPWLQVNLFTAFFAAAVVSLFQGTVNRIVLLAVFLPVLSGQCSNTGCQALAVTLRGMTLNELRPGRARQLILKEAWLGLLNGSLVGMVAAGGMYIIANIQNNLHALTLAVITFIAMAGSCVISGIAGATVPLALKRFGADPATASSIFLTTAADVVSMGMFLGLAAWWVP